MRINHLLSVAVPILGLMGCAETAYVQSPPPPPPPPAPAYVAEPPAPPPPPPQQPTAAPALSPLDQLCAPIALYPDPLISLVLPAATFPDQIQAAASYLQGGGDPSGVDQMPWDASVKGLSHYATVIQWMGANHEWATQLGGAFASEPAAVMDAIQDLRRRAQAVGTLTTTPQQQVVVYQNAVQIVPAQADVIYVPQYDPAIVYVEQPYGDQAAYFGWGRPYSTGVWLSFGFDWQTHAVYTGNWSAYHQQMGGWNRPVDYSRISVNVNFNSRGWQPPRNAPPRPPQLAFRGNVNVNVNAQARFAQPRPMAGAPRAPAGAVRVHTLEQNRPPATAAYRAAVAPRPQPQTQGQRPQPQPHPAPQVRTEQPARAAQQAQQQAQQRQQAAHPALTEAQQRQAAAQRAQQQAQQHAAATTQPHPQTQPEHPQPTPPKKPAPKKQPPKKTPEEIERERRAQEAAQHPSSPS